MNTATKTLRQVLTQLQRDQVDLAVQVSAIEDAIHALNGGRPARAAKPARVKKGMSAARRRQISKRMRAMWAKKKARA